MKYFWPLIFTLFLSSCVVEKGDVKVNIKKNNKTSQISSANVSAISILNNQVIVSGNNLSVVSALKINGVSFNELFTIESKSANQIVANANRAFSFDVSKIFELVLSDAHGSAAFPISFDLPNASVTASKLNSMGALTGQVLKYDGAEWVASTLSNSQIYLGTYDASLNVPNLNITSPISGDYYIITTAGTFNAINYEVGDWIMHNGSAWEKISNSSNVVSSFNGRRGIVVPATGDYSWSMLTTASGKLTGSTLGSIADIDLTGIANNKVLKWDATNLKWIMGDDLSGGGAGTVTSTEISDDTITNVDINSAAAIDYSKLNVPAGAIPYSKLTVADNEIPAAKVNGLTTAINGLLTATISDADTTHAPSGDAVFDALGLKLNLLGGTVTGTLIIDPTTGFLQVPTPSAANHAANQQYVLDMNALKVSKIGDTMTGVLTLDSDLKMKGGTNYVSLKANAATAADYNLTLPVSGGTAGYVLSTDGAGTTSWINPAVNSASISDGSIVNADVAAAANIDASKLATGVVENAEFNYLNGVTSAIQTQLDNKQALEATLTSLAAFNTNGIMVQTMSDTFVGRTIAGTVNRLTVTDGNGVAGNPTIDIPTALLPSPVLADAGKFLKASAADTALWSALTALDVTTALTYTPVNKAGDTLSTGTLTVNGTAHISLPVPTLLTDPTTKDYVDTQIAGASNQWTYSGGDVYRSSGNVGIGTSSPNFDQGKTIHVNNDLNDGTVLSNAAIISQSVNRAGYFISLSAASSTGGIVFRHDLATNTADGGGVTYYHPDKSMRLNTNGVERVRIDGSGNIGIGTTGPTAPLFVTHTGNTSVGVFQSTDNTATVKIDGAAGAFESSLAFTKGGTTNPRWKIGANTTLESGSNLGSDFQVARYDDSGTLVGPSLVVMRSTGNVGIGTAAPDKQLHMHSASSDNYIHITSSTTGLTSSDGVMIGTGSAGDAAFYNRENTNMLFLTNNTERVRIDNTGNVGIGTTTPNYKLDVGGVASFGGGNGNLDPAGTLTLTALQNTGKSLIGWNRAAGEGEMDFINNRGAGGTVGGFKFYDYTNAGVLNQLMTITGSGNVGIGTTTPSSALHISSGAYPPIRVERTTAVISATFANSLLMSTSTGDMVDGFGTHIDFGIRDTANVDNNIGRIGAVRSGADNTGSVVFHTANAGTVAEKMRIDNNGNVGIGTAAPTNTLNIVNLAAFNPAANVNSAVMLGSPGGSSYGGGYLMKDGVNYAGMWTTNNGASLSLAAGGTTSGFSGTAFTINASGSVGVGTTSPSYTLHVVGTAGLSTGTAWTNASDIRLKDIHGDYEYGLDEILKLHTVRYSYKKDNPLGLPSDFSKTGFIAQEVQKIIPDAVKKREDGFLELNVDPIHWAVVNSIKDLYRKYILPLWESDKLQERAIASLKESNENLKKEKDRDIAKKDREIAELKARLERIEKKLQR